MDASALRICSFESRRQEEMARLIERAHGVPTIAPSLREIPLDDNNAVFAFADRLLAGEIDIVVFMTGYGAESLFAALATRQRDQAVMEALKNCFVAVRGPKPAAVLSRLKIRIDLKAPEPNTWQDLADEIVRQSVSLAGKTVAVQEYGVPTDAFYEWLKERCADVIPVPVYRWALPEDVGPLEHAIRTTADGGFDVLLWTSAQQVVHVIEIADRLGLKREWLDAANRCVIGSIGPTCSDQLRNFVLPPDLEPSHPKMAHLVRETLEQAPAILSVKRQKTPE